MKITPAYWPAIKSAAILQAILLFFTSLLLDGGQVFRISCIAAVASLCGTAIAVVRRPETPTRFDLRLIRLGPFLWAILTMLAAPVVWRLTGQR